MPMISVIVPVYKVEPYIHRCVDSILGQSYPDFELILVDDGSPDNCGRICDEYAEKDRRIHVIHQENGGLSAARNAGIDWVFANSDSQWITFVDSDDWIHRDYLSIMLKMVCESNTKIAMCLLKHVSSFCEDADTAGCQVKTVQAETAFCQYYSMCMPAHCKLYHKSLWQKMRFPVGKLHEDAFVTHIILFEAEIVSLCHFPMYYYYQSEGSITRAKWSARRLDEVQAHEERMNFLQERGLQTCSMRQLEAYIEVLCVQLEQIRNCRTEENCIYDRMLQKKLRGALCTARRQGMHFFDEQHWGEYSLAYPNRLVRRVFFFWQVLQRIIK